MTEQDEAVRVRLHRLVAAADGVLHSSGKDARDTLEDEVFAVRRFLATPPPATPAAWSDHRKHRVMRVTDPECPECRPATPAALDVVRDLAALSVADSPKFRDPGWEDAVRALIRRARLSTPEAPGEHNVPPQQKEIDRDR